MCRLRNSGGRHDEEISTGFDFAEDSPLPVAKCAYVVQEADLCPIFGKLAH